MINSFSNLLTASDLLQTGEIDILFWDIEMPEISGIDFLNAQKEMPQAILISAHASYSLEAFDVGVTDYLQKPFGFDRFLKAVGKVY